MVVTENVCFMDLAKMIIEMCVCVGGKMPVTESVLSRPSTASVAHTNIESLLSIDPEVKLKASVFVEHYKKMDASLSVPFPPPLFLCFLFSFLFLLTFT